MDPDVSLNIAAKELVITSQTMISPQGWVFYFVLIPTPLPWAAIYT